MLERAEAHDDHIILGNDEFKLFAARDIAARPREPYSKLAFSHPELARAVGKPSATISVKAVYANLDKNLFVGCLRRFLSG